MVANTGNASARRPARGLIFSDYRSAGISSPKGDSLARRPSTAAVAGGEGGGPRSNHGFPRAPRGLNAPRAALVETAFDGTPKVVNRELVSLVREEWRVVDRWWTEEPVNRRYFEVVLESGRNLCVYRDGEVGSWFTQNA